MSQCALAVYDFDKWGHSYPRRWFSKYGGLCPSHAVDMEEFKDYRNCRKQCENSTRQPATCDAHIWPGVLTL